MPSRGCEAGGHSEKDKTPQLQLALLRVLFPFSGIFGWRRLSVFSSELYYPSASTISEVTICSY